MPVGAVVNPETTNRLIDNRVSDGAALSVDRNAVRDYLTEMYEGVPGLLQIWTVPAKGSGKFFTTDQDGIEQAVDHIALQGSVGGQQSIYARVTTLSGQPEEHKRGAVALSSHFVGLWTDLDFGMVGHAAGDKLPPDEKAAQAVYDASGLPEASITVNSGGGLYHLVLLDESLDITDPAVRQRIGGLSRRWQAQVKITAEAMGYAYGTGVSDLARVLRIPGTVNAKKWEHQRRAVHASSGLRYSLEELETACPLPVAVEGGAEARNGDWEAVPASDARDRMAQLIAEMRSCHWERNNALNRLAFMAYQLAGAGQLDPEDVRREFTDAGLSVGLEAPEVEATVRSASKGMQSPYVWTVRSRARQVAEQVDMWAGQEDETGHAVAPEETGEAVPAEERVKHPGLLPEEFWAKRSVLRHIRAAAHARCASGDATLHSVLTRLSGMVDHRIVADVGMGYVPLNLFVGVVGDSAANKTSSNRAGREMLMTPERDFRGDLPIGSGEGICEQFMGEKETGEFYEKGQKKGEPKTERGQIRHNIHFYVDEGETLIRLGRRENSTLWPTLRSAWAGDTLGQTNATADRNRYIEAGSYAFGMFVGFQPSNAEPVLRDAETGTAQRFVWCQAVDPAIPMEPVEHPGPLLVYPQLRDVEEKDGPHLVIGFPQELKTRMWRERVLRGRGKMEIHPLDKHSNVVKIKLAALMAMLDGGRWNVTMEDWELAEMMWSASSELRTALLEQADAAAAKDAEARRTATVETATAIHEAKADADVARLRIGRWVHKKVIEGVPRSELVRKVNSRDRKQLITGLRYALAQGWITEDDDGNLSPGESRPA